ncbi:hypothetical protein Q9L58_009293 [Maublancomyces gigas]|uniref:Uncharacterized protein n=1 Tax=Discina gigas TaxID=1032678 RepID=A0ABR3G7P2_9PEZI
MDRLRAHLEDPMAENGRRALVNLTAITNRKRPIPTDDATVISKKARTNSAIEPPIKPVDFTHLNSFGPRLALSDLPSITRELSACRSVAIATNFITHQQLSQLDPIGAAKHAMTEIESVLWTVFQTNPSGIRERLPVIDWTTCKVEIAPSSQKRFLRRAQAINTVYGTTVVDCENAKWFTLNHKSPLLLMKAVDRMQAAERISVRSPLETYAALVKIEIACLHHVIAIASDALLAEAGAGEITESLSVVSERGKELKAYLDTHIAAPGGHPTAV